jgi:hypothetical protein
VEASDEDVSNTRPERKDPLKDTALSELGIADARHDAHGGTEELLIVEFVDGLLGMLRRAIVDVRIAKRATSHRVAKDTDRLDDSDRTELLLKMLLRNLRREITNVQRGLEMRSE